MALFENFPYTNFHELNLDWILNALNELKQEWSEFEVMNSIIIADPAVWDQERIYRINTIVVDEEGNGYISRQNTITGVQLTDTEYWRLVFPYGISINEFKEYILGVIEEQNQAIEDKFDEQDQAIEDKFDEQDQAIEDKFDEQDEYIENNTIKNINARYFLFCGDSYTTYNNNKLFTVFCAAAGIPNGHAFNVANSGASFHNENNSFLSQLQNFTGDKTIITDIIITGGINDAILNMPTDYSSLLQNIGDWKAYARANYPNAKLHLYYCGECCPKSQYYSNHGALAQEWVRYAWYKGGADCDYQAIPFLNTFDYNFDSDMLHPTSAAQTEIGSRIAKIINYEAASYDIPTYNIAINGSGATSTEAGHNIITGTMRVFENVVMININTISAHITEDTVLSRTVFTEIGIMSVAQIKSEVNVNAMLFLNAWVGGAYYIPAVLQFKDGKLSICPKSIANGAWQSFTAGSNSTITLTEPITITIPLTNIN